MRIIIHNFHHSFHHRGRRGHRGYSGGDIFTHSSDTDCLSVFGKKCRKFFSLPSFPFLPSLSFLSSVSSVVKIVMKTVMNLLLCLLLLSSLSGSPAVQDHQSPGISNLLKSLQNRAVQAPLTNALHHTHIPKSPGKTVLLQAEVPLHGVLWHNNHAAACLYRCDWKHLMLCKCFFGCLPNLYFLFSLSAVFIQNVHPFQLSARTNIRCFFLFNHLSTIFIFKMRFTCFENSMLLIGCKLLARQYS